VRLFKQKSLYEFSGSCVAVNGGTESSPIFFDYPLHSDICHKISVATYVSLQL